MAENPSATSEPISADITPGIPAVKKPIPDPKRAITNTRMALSPRAFL
jgi:hypothetical protein